MKHKELNLDKLIISEKENNFYFASKKLEDALFKSLDKYFDWYLKNIKQKTICHDALIISKPKIIADLISIFSIDYTLNISKKTKTDLSKNPSSWLINDFMSKNFYPPNLSLLINRVMPVPEKISSGQISENFRYFIDFMKKILNPKATNIKKSSKKFIKNNDILCFVCDENVRSFFDKEDVFVVSNWKFWFNKSINSEKKIIIENLSKEISNEFTLNMIKKLNLKSSELAKLHLKKTVCLYIQKISEMMEKVKFNAEYIPKKLVIGSCGVYPYRILKWMANKQKKQVYVFDHGVGNGFSKHKLMSMIEFDSDLNFICKSGIHKKNLDKEILDFKSNVNLFVENQKDKKFNIKNTNNYKRVLFTQTIYKNFNYSFDINNEFYQIYFQYHFFELLHKKGFKITLKPHPGCNLNINKIYFPKLAEELSKFESIYNDYDIIIFDYANTSCLTQCLKSNRPILIIDHENVKLYQNVKSKLQKRVEFVTFKKNQFLLPCLDEKQVFKSIGRSIDKSMNYREFSFL